MLSVAQRAESKRAVVVIWHSSIPLCYAQVMSRHWAIAMNCKRHFWNSKPISSSNQTRLHVSASMPNYELSIRKKEHDHEVHTPSDDQY